MSDKKKQDRASWAAIAVLVILAAGVALFFVMRDTEAADRAGTRVFICAETLKEFDHRVQPGEHVPVLSPETGRATGYPAEGCFWTKLPNGEWGYKSEPTYVLLNKYQGKDGPTLCPDCGREVVPHNAQKLPKRSERDKARAAAGGS